MGPDPHLQPALQRLARAVALQQDAERALVAAALRVSGGAATPAALRALSRCEVLERRARLHVDLARSALAGLRASRLDDQRRVPAAFRRLPQRNGRGAGMEVVGTATPRERAPRDRAVS